LDKSCPDLPEHRPEEALILVFFDLAKDLNPSEVEITSWASAIQAQREKRRHVDDPYGYCLLVS
jgi:hypothetical protein